MTEISIKSNNRILVVGSTGSGKTVFVKGILLPQFDRIIFHDHKLESNDLLNSGFVLANTPDQMLNLMVGSQYKILYQPLGNNQEGYLEEFNRICELCYKNGNCTLCVDEAGYYSDASNIQEYQAEIMQRGRSRGTGIINVAQRPVNIHNLLISEAEHVFMFSLNLEKDIEKLKAVVPKDMHAQMYELKEFEYIYCGTNRIRKLCCPVVYHD